MRSILFLSIVIMDLSNVWSREHHVYPAEDAFTKQSAAAFMAKKQAAKESDRKRIQTAIAADATSLYADEDSQSS